MTPVPITQVSPAWDVPPVLDAAGRPLVAGSPGVYPVYVGGVLTGYVDADGDPVTVWEPSTVTVADVGTLQVICQGLDYTYLRGVPCLVRGWTKNEPFGDATADLFFPQITVFDRMSWGDRDALRKGADVTINLVRPDASKTVLFEGFVVAHHYDGHDGVGVECLGALYQADLQLQPPPFHLEAEDIGTRLADLLDGTLHRRFGLCNRPVTGIMTRQRGAWGQRLTGGAQDMLALATVDDGSTQWTIHKRPGRVPVIELKDRTTIQWTVAAGTPGVLLRISDDAATAVNTYYGEGIDPEGCIWRNSKYPNLRMDDAPGLPVRRPVGDHRHR